MTRSSISAPPSTASANAISFVLITIGIDVLGFSLIWPILPDLIMALSHEPASATGWRLGALLSACSAMQFFCAPLLGALSDRFGRRPVLLISLGGTFLSYLVLAWAPSLIWLFIGRLIVGATGANVTTAFALIADVTPAEKRAVRFGQVGAVCNLAFTLGPAAGGLLAGYGLHVPFLAAAGLSAANLVYGIIVLPESLPTERRRALAWQRINPISSMNIVFKGRFLAGLTAAWGCGLFAYGALSSSFVLANQLRLGWRPAANGWALAANGLANATVQGLLLHRVISRLGEAPAALTGFALSAIGYACFAFGITPGLVLAGIVFCAVGSISGAATQAMISARIPPDRQGESQGALMALNELATIVSPPACGWLFGEFTRSGSLQFAGAPFLAAAALFMLACVLVRKTAGFGSTVS